MEAALVGLLVGLLAFVGTMIALVVSRVDADRWRFAEQKRTMYVDLLIEAEKHYKVLDVQTSEGSEHVRGERVAEPGMTIPPITPVEAARDAIHLVGSHAAVTTGDRLFDSIVDIGRNHAWKAGQTVDPRGPEWDRRVGAYTDAKLAFTAAARADLLAEPRSPWHRLVGR